MQAVIQFLEKLRFQVVSLLIGVLLILLASFQVEDLKALALSPWTTPIYPVLFVGIGLVMVGVAGATISTLQESKSRQRPTSARIDVTAEQVTVQIGQNRLSVKLGRLEDSAQQPLSSLVVLPANEYFNDTCINDVRTSLGAFVQSRFPGRSLELRRVLADKLRQVPCQKAVVDTQEVYAYGLGTAIYLDRPLNEACKLLVVAATTERSGEGLRGDLAALFPIVREANRVAREHRLNEILTPVIGAGHGSLGLRQALFTQVFAWCDILYRNPGQRTEVNIIVFRSAKTGTPDLMIAEVFHLVRLAAEVYELPASN